MLEGTIKKVRGFEAIFVCRHKAQESQGQIIFFTPDKTNSSELYKWTKISSLEIYIFDLKNDGEKCSRFFVNSTGLTKQASLATSLALGSQNFKIKNSRPLFNSIS